MVVVRDVAIYIDDARNLTQLLCNKFLTRYPLKPHLQDRVAQRGRLDENIIYYYHGQGCSFSKRDQKNYELNVDYTDDMIILSEKKIYHFIFNAFSDQQGDFDRINKLIQPALYSLDLECKIVNTILGVSRCIDIFDKS